MSLLDPRAMRLIERMLEGKVKEITPTFQPRSKLGFAYPEIDEILEASSEQSIEILEALANRGVLKKGFFERLHSCPACKSFEVHPRLSCPRCGSSQLTRGEVLEHYACGHIGVHADFRSGDRLVCPKCHKELRAIGADYRKAGWQHKCESCKELFPTPLEKWRCISCGNVFPFDEAGSIDMHSYYLNEALRQQLWTELKPKQQILELLRRQGYDAQSSVRVVGSSGAQHELDIYGVRRDGTHEKKIIVAFSTAEKEVGPEEVLKLFAKSIDTAANETVMIAVPKLRDDAKIFADHYRVRFLEAGDLRSAAERFAGEVK